MPVIGFGAYAETDRRRRKRAADVLFAYSAPSFAPATGPLSMPDDREARLRDANIAVLRSAS